MKYFALALALSWWAQGAICLLPPAHVHSSGAVAAESLDHASQGHHGDTASHHSGAPAPARDTHSEDHCASLSQALPLLADAISSPVTFFVPSPRYELGTAVPLTDPRVAVIQSHRPRSDLCLELASLLI